MSEYYEEIIREIIRIKEINRGSVLRNIGRRNQKYMKADLAIPKKIILEIYALEVGIELNDFLSDIELENISKWQERISKKYPAEKILVNQITEHDTSAGKSERIRTKKRKTVNFINLDYFEGPIYPQIVKELNRAYKKELNTCIFFLSRKILENYVIDILKENFPQRKDLWQYTKRNGVIVIHSLSKLITNLCKEKNLLPKANLSNYHTNIQDFEHKLNKIKNITNPSVHSLAITPQDIDVNELKDLMNSVFPILYRLMN